jgi:GNAT superfamily N-acetyltransferase
MASDFNIRRTVISQDFADLADLDTEYEVKAFWEVETSEAGFRLSTSALERPVRAKMLLPAVDEATGWDFSEVAMIGGAVKAISACVWHGWNKRLSIQHLYVDREHRGRGVGFALLNSADRFASSLGAVHLWIETSNRNVPAIQTYRRWGFELCGVDTALYRGTTASDEFAIFLKRDCT